jgi:hypothetical protein
LGVVNTETGTGRAGTEHGAHPLTTKEGWARFVAEQPCRPQPCPAAVLRDPAEQERYKEARLTYLSDPITVHTPMMCPGFGGVGMLDTC